MPRSEHGASRFSNGGQHKPATVTLDDSTETEVYAEVHVGPSRAARKSDPQRPQRSQQAAPEDGFLDMNAEALSTAPPLRLFAALFPRTSWTAQAFQYALSEGGMALLTAFMLVLLSLAGIVTMFIIVPSRTTGIVQHLTDMVANNVDTVGQASLKHVVPEVLTLLQVGLQAMVVPTFVLGLGGVFVLSSADRRRPGCWLVGYGFAAVVVGLALLFLLLRVALSGHVGGLEERINASLYEVWSALDGEVAPCHWEQAFACSGFHMCCVTNTTPLEGEANGLDKAAEWDSLCFVTLPDGEAVTQDGTIVTTAAHAQCGDLQRHPPADNDSPPFTTACGLITAGSTSSLVTCENYVLGQLTSTLGFELCLLLAITVCSLVSGAVAISSSLQRTRSADFMLVNAPATAVSEKRALPKSRA